MFAFHAVLALRKPINPPARTHHQGPRMGVLFLAQWPGSLLVAVLLLSACTWLPQREGPVAEEVRLACGSDENPCTSEPGPLDPDCAYVAKPFTAQILEPNEDAVDPRISLYVPDLRRRFTLERSAFYVHLGEQPIGIGLAVEAHVSIADDPGCEPYLSKLLFLE